MFGNRKLRKVNLALQEKVELREAELRTARLNEGQANREAAEWKKRAIRFSDDRCADAKKHARTELNAAGLVVQVADWSVTAVDHAERLGRALRACARYRRDIAAQNRLITVAERLGDRALQPALPSPELERLRRENRELRELTHRQQEQLSAHQAASMLADRCAQRAVADREPAAA
jgi:cytolysin (calcineurin-like family phosphatase)